ncbi:hypothetical protein [Embleya sp. AB8]|uniref:hypothetical protein n=1 Tax=Embleya sp. AB8 TaxID=3156304 RepID=UPI003C74DB8B
MAWRVDVGRRGVWAVVVLLAAALLAHGHLVSAAGHASDGPPSVATAAIVPAVAEDVAAIPTLHADAPEHAARHVVDGDADVNAAADQARAGHPLAPDPLGPAEALALLLFVLGLLPAIAHTPRTEGPPGTPLGRPAPTPPHGRSRSELVCVSRT